jgi:hypothetical protein
VWAWHPDHADRLTGRDVFMLANATAAVGALPMSRRLSPIPHPA